MSKYKFALNPRIKGIVEWQLEHYREDKSQLASVKADMTPSMTASYSLTGGITNGNGVNRSTENAAIRITTNQYIRQLEQSCDAIEKVLLACQDIDIRLIELVYWRREYTVEGAGMKLHMSTATAYRHINNILSGIAVEFGYVDM